LVVGGEAEGGRCARGKSKRRRDLMEEIDEERRRITQISDRWRRSE
jgi:hypothetical protein